MIAGVSGRATYNRYFVYVREELQHDPGALARSNEQAQYITTLDETPNDYPATAATPAYERIRPIEMYAGVAFGGNAISFGKQELYWGPTVIGPLAFSSNAEPTLQSAVRRHTSSPISICSKPRNHIGLTLSSANSPVTNQPNRPYYNGAKIDLTFGPYLELSFTRWSILWGVGHPMTLESLKRNLFSFNATGGQFYGARNDPGDRKSGFDFRLHVPGSAQVRHRLCGLLRR